MLKSDTQDQEIKSMSINQPFKQLRLRTVQIIIVVSSLIFVLLVIRNASPTINQYPETRFFDGVEMILVPEGCFLMGRNKADIEMLISQFGVEFVKNQGPQSEICFNTPFWIDKYLVTNAQFALHSGQADRPSLNSGPDHPRENVTWFEARDFCARRQSRLPTEAEWEYVARGPSNLIYPWGNNWDPNNAVWVRFSDPLDMASHTERVGNKPSGISWVGALDMSGNVWQWTNSISAAYPYNSSDGREDSSDLIGLRVLRGGSSIYGPLYLQTTYRVADAPHGKDSHRGFRCARDYQRSAAEH
jgi:formylglycine-generating enzyme required for sulfatase activity